MSRITGIYEKLGDLNYFIPNPLPPHDPVFSMDEELIKLYGSAMQHLGQLNEVVKRVPDKKRFIKAYVIKEALLSSAIENIHTTLFEVFTRPITESKINKETQLVLNYITALDTAIDMIKKDGFPIVSRVILKAHELLMNVGEGDKASPGQYRKQSVRVGHLIPPQAQQILSLMADLEQFINNNDSLDPLIKAGLAHVQFETIHPFLDGNGRIGRLLIVLMLIESSLLSVPIIYPSYYFKKHHHEYYVFLDRVRTHGDFEGWIKYYLTAIQESSKDAYNRIKDIESLELDIKQLIHINSSFEKIQEISQQALSVLFQFPIISTTELSKRIDRSYNSTNNIIQQFVTNGILTANRSQQRNKLYCFDAYLKVLEKEY